ncbi:MAG TPA: hypothetical protein H9668_07680 [Firmicutes bacterium]|nr:hypothetical protein [Bacillota bacterium]
MKKLQIVFLILLCLMVLVPVFTMNTEENAVSAIDNRELTELTTEADDYTDMLDNYAKDRIGFRENMITAFTEFNDLAFGEMIHPTYAYGKDGYVFFNFTEENVDTAFIEAFCAYLRQAQDYLEARGIPFLYCLNPAKTTVYSQYLPAGYTYENKFNTAMIEALERYGVNYIQNVDLLKEKTLTEQVYNVKYDAGHWNDLGCFYGTNHLLSAVSRIFPSVSTLSVNQFDIGTRLETTLPVSKFTIHEEVPLYTNKNLDAVEYLTDSYFDLQMSESHRTFSYALNPDESLPDLLFFHGSYYNGERTKFYQTSFHEAVGVHNYENFINLDYYVNIFQPDLVILETAEYATTASYFDTDALLSKVLNPAYDTVADIPHDSVALADLDVTRTSEEGSALTTIQFPVEDDVAYGYIQMAGHVYDLAIEDGMASLTLETENYYDIDATAELFSSQP